VAGTIAAARNGLGIAGIAPGVQISSIKAMNDSGYLFPEYVICAFMFAAKKGVEVTNNSYYMDPWYFWCKNDPDQGAVQESLKRVIEYTHKQGIINVAAAGNENYDLANKTTDSLSPNDSEAIPNRPVNKKCLDIPTEIDGVVTTSAIQQSLAKASFSNYGLDKIDVAAPGVGILSTTWPGSSSYGSLSGTSMASPHVAGVVALIESVDPGLSVDKMLKRLYKTAVDKACPGGTSCEGSPKNNGYFGRGIVNAKKAVK
jgi:subtilisin family serine protease